MSLGASNACIRDQAKVTPDTERNPIPVLGRTGKTGCRVAERLTAVPRSASVALRRPAVRRGGTEHLGSRSARSRVRLRLLLPGPRGPWAARPAGIIKKYTQGFVSRRLQVAGLELPGGGRARVAVSICPD
jgi:hypothetical protein